VRSERLEHDWYSQPLPPSVRLEARSWLYSSYSFAHFASRSSTAVYVGNDSGLYHGTFFDLGPNAEIHIGEYCSIVGAIFATNGRVSIGDYSFIAHEVVIADTHWATPHQDDSGNGSSRAETLQSNIEIGRNVWIGAHASIIGNVRIGEGAIIGAGTVVTENVPEFAVCVGNPMRIVRSVPPSNK
jgi:acetyltransferase-like isoleucine patch superfamily enzyme